MAKSEIDRIEAIRNIASLRTLEATVPSDLRSDIRAVRELLEDAVGRTVRRAEAARVFGLTQAAFDRWVDRGDVAAVRTPNGRTEVPLDEVVSILEELRNRDSDEARPFAKVMRERRERAEQAADLDRLLPRPTKQRRHRVPELQSLAYHRLVAERLDDRILDDARERLRDWRQRGSVHPVWIDAWERVLAKPAADVARSISVDSKRANELRQTSPFAGVLTEQERKRLMNAVEDRFG